MATSKIWARFVAAATISLVVMGTSGLFASADPSQVTPVTVNPSPILLNGRTASANVVNQTALELTLRFSVVDPKGAAVDSSIMISGQGPGSGPVTLAPASTVKIALDMTPRDDTRLVVQVDPRSPALPTGGVVRVPIITTAAAVPAVDAWTSIATFEPNLAVPPYFGTSASIPVEGTCSGLGSDGSVIGTVQANGKAIPVKAACPSADDRVVKVSFEPLDWDGWKSTSYTGNLDLTPADDDSGEVSITLVGCRL